MSGIKNLEYVQHLAQYSTFQHVFDCDGHFGHFSVHFELLLIGAAQFDLLAHLANLGKCRKTPSGFTEKNEWRCNLSGKGSYQWEHHTHQHQKVTALLSCTFE